MPAINTSLAGYRYEKIRRRPSQVGISKRRRIEVAKQKNRKRILSAQGTFSASRSSPRKDRERSVRTLSIPHRFEGRLVAKAVFTRLDNESKPSGDRLAALCCLGLFGGGHWCSVDVGEGVLRIDLALTSPNADV